MKRIKKHIYDTIKELKIKNFILLTLAGIINACGVVLFLFPVKLYDSGISGASMLLDQVTPPMLTLPLFLLILNAPIFLFGMKRQGVTFTIYSIYAVTIYSLASSVLMNLLPIVDFASPLAERDLLLCAIFGGAISGVGSGLTIRFGGAIDGLDVLSVIFAKKLGISIGSFVLFFNVLLYIICGITLESWILPLYSIVTYFVGSKIIDYVTDEISRLKCAMIVTSKAHEICDELSNNFQSTGTIVDCIGGYSKKSKKIIYFNINRFQINKLRLLVHSIDDGAYISIQEVCEVIKAPNK